MSGGRGISRLIKETRISFKFIIKERPIKETLIFRGLVGLRDILRLIKEREISFRVKVKERPIKEIPFQTSQRQPYTEHSENELTTLRLIQGIRKSPHSNGTWYIFRLVVVNSTVRYSGED